MRTLWSGAISFGLVNVPIKATSATKDQDLHFNQLHDMDGQRIQYRKVCPTHGEVSNHDIVKGYEISPGKYVTLDEDEMDTTEGKPAHIIEIEDFVPLEQIDPIQFEATYYLAPGKNAGKAYSLLVAALDKSKRVGVARLVLRGKESLVALRVLDGVIALASLRFADEVVPASAILEEMKGDLNAAEPKQLAMAKSIIDGLSRDFEAARYKNHHRDRLMEIIEAKAAGKKIIVQPLAASEAPTDLEAALEKSIAQVRRKEPAAAAKARKSNAPAAPGRAKRSR